MFPTTCEQLLDVNAIAHRSGSHKAVSLKSLVLTSGALLASTALVSAEELTIATVNNSDMIIMQELS